jgi:hypothetical protein
LRPDRASFSRSYGCNLPSSFSIVLSSALVFSTIPPVSVWGTVYMWKLFPGCHSSPFQSNKEEQVTATVTFHRPTNINVVPIDYAFRPRLRSRLTLFRLTLNRNPWNFGESVSHTLLVTHVSILSSDTSSIAHATPSQAYRMLRYRAYKVCTLSFGRRLKTRYIFAARRLI